MASSHGSVGDNAGGVTGAGNGGGHDSGDVRGGGAGSNGGGAEIHGGGAGAASGGNVYTAGGAGNTGGVANEVHMLSENNVGGQDSWWGAGGNMQGVGSGWGGTYGYHNPGYERAWNPNGADERAFHNPPSLKLDFPKFNGEEGSFGEFKTKLLALMRVQGVYDAVIGEMKGDFSKSTADIQARCSVLNCHLAMALSGPASACAFDGQSLAQRWSALVERFGGQGPVSRLSALRSLVTVKQGAKQSVLSFVDSKEKLLREKLSNQLTATEVLQSAILLGVHSKHAAVVNSILTTTSQVTFAEVKARLAESERAHLLDGSTENDLANVGGGQSVTALQAEVARLKAKVKKTQGAKGPPNKDLSKVRCHKCRQLGHFARDCSTKSS